MTFRLSKLLHFTFYILYSTSLLSCSLQKKLNRSASETIFTTAALKTAHIGINIFEPATGKTWYDYQGDKYFVPASNTKIPTCYAAMKYLGDSLAGLRYENSDDNTIIIYATGDPSFLHPDFDNHRSLDFLKTKNKSFYLSSSNWHDEPLGSGWSWNDYNEYYMAERSAFPMHGNLIHLKLNSSKYELREDGVQEIKLDWNVSPSYFEKNISDHYVLPARTLLKNEYQDSLEKAALKRFSIRRALGNNNLSILPANSTFSSDEIPFYTNKDSVAISILRHDYSINIQPALTSKDKPPVAVSVIYSQPIDSVLKPMMHRSDNFFAEQLLLMVSDQQLRIMNDASLIDHLLKTDLKDLPQKPRWVDGSGLSRYNLFTPQNFVAILNKMRSEFGMERLKQILPTGGEGTISSYYKADSNFIFAKTGTLSGVVALSGFLYTRKNKLLIFSVLVNNHQDSATEVRRAIERFIHQLRLEY